MKGIIRTFIFVLISLFSTNYVLSSLFYGSDQKTFVIIALALTLLFYLGKPLLATFGLPTRGVGFLFIATILSTLTIYVLTIFLPDFTIMETTLSDLIIFGFMLPSKSLTAFWSALFSAFILSVVYTFFEWLCASKK
ncbi:hypothetical protein A2473_02340 [candidate division WWE3 bacterium RIFOXYC2_FULL_42_13]|uniref:Phage holin family protein n=1 Tax=candidate division WWE3 bacterium TaxID=2053526 RepID=A0A3D0ZNR9_UNCKA|nr:MAG: hypothetical protein A2245_03505 [candidate division WWE3 bacterium RIFOXYA2_FULL_43_12]OGC66635.1 MAG: hypothetical protein A2274_03795 [candidate division WWE3 bacterium RIFOXYA12_FULL_43_11]OGC73106.1 MAG: hypothetical protein A2473_02340 [candidate division WWE3 bacterium RIFOXYC2_FULL_42_13]OGC73505.1 MAG: hypothetical protein A2337_00690 [candidate division WWE3 bacterium RIFOXYB2_FULL_43_9]OGC74665.1 MAG: hypothetical protein A2547_04165 [candidate division WWE3 bacterium RIFOXYD